MPIDIVGQGGTPPARPVSVPQPLVAVKRQHLPGEGRSSPPPVAGSAGQDADIKQAVRDLNTYVQSLRRDLHFTIDDESGKTIIKVMDPESGEMIRQIPSEELLAIARTLQQAQGLLLNAKA